MPSLHYVRKDGVTYDINGDVLEQKANIDGYYQDLGAGIANQLKSDITVEDKVPYLFRTSGGSVDIGDREVDEIVGGTVAWNQLFDKSKAVGKSSTSSGSISIDSSTGVVTITADGSSTSFAWHESSSAPLQQHKVLVSQTVLSNKNITYAVRAEATSGYTVITANTPTRLQRVIAVGNYTGTAALGGTVAGITEATDITISDIMFTDLTLAFGSQIADYVYTLGQGTTGAGIAWLNSHFPRMFDQYNAYEPGTLESVTGVSAHEMVGFNQWDEETVLGYFGVDGQWSTSSANLSSKNPIPVLPNTTYYFNSAGKTGYITYWTKEVPSGTTNYTDFISRTGSITNGTFTTPANCHAVHFNMVSAYGTTYNHDICIHLDWDGSRRGEYEPYVKHSYALDDSITLRGIPKLDANNSLYYDGDTYESDGTVTRRYGVVDLGTLTWAYNTTYKRWQSSSLNGSIFNFTSNSAEMVSDKWIGVTSAQAGDSGVMFTAYGNVFFYTSDSANSPTGTLVYPLATPTTEQATPYTNPQIVDDFGTEEYVTDSIVPVGHVTQYMANLKAKLEMAPDSPSGDGDYLVRQVSGTNEYVSLASNATIQDMLARIEALENA